MKHPDPKDIRNVADRLLRVARKYPGEVNMGCTMIYKPPECGTVACHAGWYALAKVEDETSLWVKRADTTIPVLRYADGKPLEFYRGIKLMANDLGFRTSTDMRGWADCHPELWGNNHGDRMFGSAQAFGKVAGSVFSVKDIAEHWLAVADRIEALTKPKVETGSWSEIESLTGWSVLDNA